MNENYNSYLKTKTILKSKYHYCKKNTTLTILYFIYNIKKTHLIIEINCIIISLQSKLCLKKLECGETIIKKKTLGDNNPIHSTCITIIIIQNTRFMKKHCVGIYGIK